MPSLEAQVDLIAANDLVEEMAKEKTAGRVGFDA